MPDTYSGPVRLTDPAGERHTVAATLEALDDGEWLGILSAPLDWPALGGGRLTVELPGNRWWDEPFVSVVEIDLVLGTHVRVHGHAMRSSRSSAARHSTQRACGRAS